MLLNNRQVRHVGLREHEVRDHQQETRPGPMRPLLEWTMMLVSMLITPIPHQKRAVNSLLSW